MNGELGWGDEQGGLTGWGDQRVGWTGRCAPRPPARHPTRSQLLSSPPTPPHSSSPHPVSDTQLPVLPPVNPPRNAHAPAATATTPTCRPAALRQTPCSRGSWRRRTDPPTAGTSREDVDVGVDEAQATIPIQRIPPDPIQNSRSVGPSPSALPWPPPQRRASAHAATRRPRTSSSYRSVRSCAREKDRFEFESLSESLPPRLPPGWAHRVWSRSKTRPVRANDGRRGRALCASRPATSRPGAGAPPAGPSGGRVRPSLHSWLLGLGLGLGDRPLLLLLLLLHLVFNTV